MKAPLNLNLGWFGTRHWCVLLGHHCDSLKGACDCTCHHRRGQKASTERKSGRHATTN